MKLLTTLISLIISVSLPPLAATACPVCLESAEGINPRLVELISRIEDSGAETIPELRELAADDGEMLDLRTAAVRHLGIFLDRGSIPTLRKIVLDILGPEPVGGSSALRDAAAAALGAMRDRETADILWRGRSEMSLERRVEIPRLLTNLGDPRALARQIEMLESGSDDAVAFQAIVELRRSGDATAIPAIEKWLEVWRAKAASEENLFVRKDLNHVIRYVENTLRVLRNR